MLSYLKYLPCNSKKFFGVFPYIGCSRSFSQVWGERTIKWIEQETSKHFQHHSGDYDFKKIPFLVDDDTSQKVLGRQRCGIVTPCVKLSSSTWLIEDLIRRNYRVTGIAMPEVNLQYLMSRLRLSLKKTENEGGSEVQILEGENLEVEKRRLDTYVPKKDGWQSFDVVFDEQPLLGHCDPTKMPFEATIKTTVFGHALRKGGILYVQAEGAENFDEKTKLMKKMKENYPDECFVLVAERRLSWTRQFLYLKATNSLKM